MTVTQAQGAQAPDSAAPGDRVRFAPSVSLTKAEAFGACQALADADRVLLKSGRTSEATALGDLFELLEQRLASVADQGHQIRNRLRPPGISGGEPEAGGGHCPERPASVRFVHDRNAGE